MLVKYKQDYEKIALGLLSFTPDLKDFNHLSAELANYVSDSTLELDLWRDAHGDFVGIVGFEIADNYILLRHLAFTPDFRTKENAFEVLDALKGKFNDKRLMATVSLTEIVSAWERQTTTGSDDSAPVEPQTPSQD
ncbi:N-acetyltransferase [Lapidilactobacillus gannanensis]|jgi:riboflavin biosynthesis RibT protein|uniref:N-acetyltransferase n=1 Tax=Lapidilactobacillus gannanensis TaxID=2486002 RepID=A0ABW4BPR9_9LACO|nr:N-acetyltransferase [Lapidilactobacillus gannanensis]MCH4057399.1 N-acetyltransferase [Lactobacillaceae bacterium]